MPDISYHQLWLVPAPASYCDIKHFLSFQKIPFENVGLQCLYPCPAFDIFIWRRSRGGKVRGEVCVQLRGVQGMDFPGSSINVNPQVESQ